MSTIKATIILALIASVVSASAFAAHPIRDVSPAIPSSPWTLWRFVPSAIYGTEHGAAAAQGFSTALATFPTQAACDFSLANAVTNLQKAWPAAADFWDFGTFLCIYGSPVKR